MERVVRRAHPRQHDPLVPALDEVLFDRLERRGRTEPGLGLLDGSWLVQDVPEIRSLDDAQRLTHSDPLTLVWLRK